MADEIRRMQDYTTSDINDNIAEVRTARGEYDSLDDRLDEIESGGFTPTQAQLDAMNSTATQAKINQIQTNKNNIISLYNQNGKTFNVIDWTKFGGNSDTGIKYSYVNDTITAVGTKLTNDSYLSIAGVSSVIKTNTWYALVCTITGSPRISARIFGFDGSTYTQLSDSAGLAYFNSGNYQSYICRIVVAGSSGDSVNATIKPMLIEKSLYDAGFTDYQPFALPNTTLTPALVECVDNGAKNLLDFSASTPIAPPGTTVTDNGDGTYTIAKTSSNLDIPYIAAYIKAGTYIYSGCPAGGSDSTYRLDIRTSTGGVVGDGEFGNGVKITIPSDDWYRITCRLAANYTTTGITIKPMLCDPALWAVSHKFVSYAKNNANLTANVLSLQDNYVKSVITNTGTSFAPDTNCQYLVLIQSSTSSALYGVYKTSAINIAKIAGNLTTDSVTESDGVVTISISAWSVISVFRIGF